MITIFSTLKPDIGYRQRNAVTSWAALPRCEVLLIGDEARELAGEKGARWVGDVERTELGTPLLDSLFSVAQDNSPNHLFLYVNDDVILFDDIVWAAEECASQFGRFLMVGQRTELTVRGEIDFSDQDWQDRLGPSRLMHPCGCDYFVFTRGLWSSMLPLAIGRTTFDNWLIWSTLRAGLPVVNATQIVTAIHQTHAPNPVSRTGPEARRNQEIAGIVGKGYEGWVSHATHQMGE